jgi:prolyl-tRNA synthetase
MKAPENVDYDSDLEPIINAWTHLYAVTDEKRDSASEAQIAADVVKARGIEVGHIFHFGTKYSTAMKAVVAGPDGTPVTVMMGSYGIGVSRLVGAIIEANHDDAGIIWPDSVAPYLVGLINVKSGDAPCDAACEKIYAELTSAGISVLYDDRDHRAGIKFADMDLIGLPWQVIVGPKLVARGEVEIKRRAGGGREELALHAVVERVGAKA